MPDVMRQDPETGKWEPAKPLPVPFGIRWERHWKRRKADGQRLSLLRSWFDARREAADG